MKKEETGICRKRAYFMFSYFSPFPVLYFFSPFVLVMFFYIIFIMFLPPQKRISQYSKLLFFLLFPVKKAFRFYLSLLTQLQMFRVLLFDWIQMYTYVVGSVVVSIY